MTTHYSRWGWQRGASGRIELGSSSGRFTTRKGLAAVVRLERAVGHPPNVCLVGVARWPGARRQAPEPRTHPEPPRTTQNHPETRLHDQYRAARLDLALLLLLIVELMVGRRAEELVAPPGDCRFLAPTTRSSSSDAIGLIGVVIVVRRGVRGVRVVAAAAAAAAARVPAHLVMMIREQCAVSTQCLTSTTPHEWE